MPTRAISRFSHHLWTLSSATVFALLILTSFSLGMYLDLMALSAANGDFALPEGMNALAGMISTDVRTFGSTVWVLIAGSTMTITFGNILGAGPLALAWGATLNLGLALAGTALAIGG